MLMKDVSAAGPDYAVVASKLCKSYGPVKAVDDISFKIKKGEIVGFLGPNGAGKSTTMRILSGLMPATSGRAYIWGKSVANAPQEARRHLGYMPESNPLPEDVRVVEYLRFRAKIKGVRGRDVKKSVEEAMEVCRIHRKASRKIIGNLSKGFRQRVGIADALLSHPEVIIMDEPTIGLDPHQIIAIRELINSLRGRMSVIISSHILPEIEQVCDRVMIINQGRVVAEGEPEALRDEFLPGHVYEVTVKASKEEICPLLPEIAEDLSIVSCSKPDAEGFVSYQLKTSQKEPLGEEISGAFCANKSFRLREVHYVRPTLEDIFMAATRLAWQETNNPSKKKRGVSK